MIKNKDKNKKYYLNVEVFMSKEIFISSYKNKKDEQKFSIGVTPVFLQSLYSLEKEAFEELFDQISDHIEKSEVEISEEKISKLTDFLKLYFSF